MSRTPLRDNTNHIIGYRETKYDGSVVIAEPSGRVLGTYYPKSNETRDATNHSVGKGDLLVALLMDWRSRHAR